MSNQPGIMDLGNELGIRLEIMRVCADRSIPDHEVLPKIAELERQIKALREETRGG